MRRILLLIGALVLLYCVAIEGKKGRSNKNQRNFWDIWGSEETKPVAAETDDLFLENDGEGSGNNEAGGTHGDDEDFDVSSGDGDVTTRSPSTEDPDDYDDYYDEGKDVTTERPKKEKPTDDEDLYEGSGEEGSGKEMVHGCPLGQYMDVANNLCRHCEVGTYRDAFSGDMCVQCPDGLLTPTTGATSDAQCSEKPGKPTKVTPCQQLRATALDVAEFIPRCKDDGAFEKQQCTKEHCWCVNPHGVEIAGTRLKNPTTPDCDFGTNLTTCVFQLVQHSQGLIGQYKPKCTLDGQYEPIQCQGSECWCVDGIGNEILGTFSKLPDIPDCGDKKETTMKTTKKPKHDNKPYQPKKDDGYDVIPGEDTNVIVNVGDKIDIDSDETDREREEERTNRIGDNDTVYADKVQQSPLMAKPGLLAAIIAGAVVGLLLMVLLVMFIVYRMRKKDEGSYPLDEQKFQNYPYAKAPTKEFYA